MVDDITAGNAAMIGLSFAVPAWWPVLLVLPVVAAVGVWRQRRRARVVHDALGPRAERLLGAETNTAVRRLLALLALVCLAVAFLQPVAGDEDAEPAGPDIFVGLDVSWSMAAQDLQPSRYRSAVAEIAALAAGARGARLGLVAFAGEARLLVPLCTDIQAVAAVADRLAPGAELRGGTDLGAAIDAAVEALERAGSAAGNIVLLTDGEDFAGKGLAAAARARARGVVVHCIGYGTDIGSKIAVEDEGGQSFLRDASGEEVISQLDPEVLTALAAAGGGEYGSGAEPGALGSLYDNRMLPRARDVAVATAGAQLAHRFQWPLLAAFVLWMLRFVIPERRS